MLDGGFCPYPAAVPVNDALHRCQPDARAFKFVVAVKALKWPEQVRRVFHVEARAVVAHKVHLLIIRSPESSKLDQGRGMVGRKLPGIADQIVKRDVYETLVTIGRDIVLDDKLNLSIRRSGPQVVGNGPGHFAQVNAITLHGRSRYL